MEINKLFYPKQDNGTNLVTLSLSEQRLSYCGNNLVEPPEEQCDVGPEGQKDEDPCCTKDCTLRAGKECR